MGGVQGNYHAFRALGAIVCIGTGQERFIIPALAGTEISIPANRRREMNLKEVNSLRTFKQINLANGARPVDLQTPTTFTSKLNLVGLEAGGAVFVIASGRNSEGF